MVSYRFPLHRPRRLARRAGAARFAHLALAARVLDLRRPGARRGQRVGRTGRDACRRVQRGDRAARARTSATLRVAGGACRPACRGRRGTHELRSRPRLRAAQGTRVTRVAAVDLGTNSTRLLVADVEDGAVEEVVRRTVVTRLGEGVDARRRLLPVPVARVRNVLSDFRREAEALGVERTLAVATSALRDAENGEAFLGEVEWSYGFATRLLSGDDEARMTLRGVGTDGGLAPGTVVLDVGGGSTELIELERRVSLDIGSVRLTEQFLH